MQVQIYKGEEVANILLPDESSDSIVQVANRQLEKSGTAIKNANAGGGVFRSCSGSDKIISDVVAGDAEVREFYKLAKCTPCTPLPGLAKLLSIGELYVKDESFRFGLNAFKGVGGYFATNKILAENSNVTTLCTATDGNHGNAIAWAANHFGKEAVVLVPKDTSEASIKRIEGHGAKVINTGKTYDETVVEAEKTVRERGSGWALIQDTAWKGYEQVPLWIMQGYLRMCHEMEETLFPKAGSNVDIVILQVGVGSFAAAITAYLINRYGEKAPKIIYAEPKEADGLYESVKAGKLSTSKGAQETIMAGLNCGTPSSIGFPIMRDYANRCFRLSDEEILGCIKELQNPKGSDTKIDCGESGACVGVAVLKQLIKENDLSKSRILIWNTEGSLV